MIYDSWEPHYEEYKSDYDEIFRLAMLSNNVEKVNPPKLAGRQYTVPVASATDALQFSLMAAGVGPGDEVLVSDFSWISSASCISYVGATPVFCDIDLETYTMSLESIIKMVSPKTKALVYTHLFGNIADSAEEIEKWCYENGIVFIEDAAQSLGASNKKGRKAGTFGEYSSFSFNSNKIIAGINGGGVLLTDDKSKAEFVDKASRHGRNEFLGRNSKAYLLNTEIIKFRMKFLNQIMERKQQIAEQYNNELEFDFIVPEVHEGHNFHKYVIRFDDPNARDQARKLGFGIHYGVALSDNIMYKSIEHRKDECVNSRIAANTVLSLPIHPYVTDEEINTTVNKLLMI
jgi:dTDP-4-amino-4,6-dideoxygalactose transaminase